MSWEDARALITTNIVDGPPNSITPSKLRQVLTTMGDALATGAAAGLRYKFDTGTTNADPGAGKLRFNNATLASATALYVSETDDYGANLASFLATWDDVTSSSIRGTLLITGERTPSDFVVFNVTGAVTDSGSYNGIVVTYVSGSGSFDADDALRVQFFRTGEQGFGNPGGESVLMTFSATTTDSDPGTGIIRLNNAALASVTQAFIDELSPASVDISAWIDTWDDSTNTTNKAVVKIARASAPAANFAIYYLTSVTSASGYRKLNLTHIVSTGSLTTTASDTIITIERIGNIGATGPAGSVADGDKGDIVVSASGATWTIDSNVLSAFMRTVLDDADALAARTTLGIGTGDSPQFTAIQLGHASDTTLSRAAAGELAVEGTVVKKVGRETIWIPAVAMYSRTTNGAASGTAEMSTNRNMFRTLDFDTATQEFAQFEIHMPKSWNLGTVTFQPVWSHASTTTNFGVVWALEAVARSDDDAGDVAFGTAQTSTDTGGTTNDIYIGPESAAITIGGSPATGDTVLFQIKRNPADAADTLAIDARLHGLRLFFTTNAATDA